MTHSGSSFVGVFDFRVLGVVFVATKQRQPQKRGQSERLAQHPLLELQSASLILGGRTVQLQKGDALQVNHSQKMLVVRGYMSNYV